jgi:hypothetical protein
MISKKTKRQRVLRVREQKRKFAKSERAIALEAARTIAEAHPTPKLTAMKSIRIRNIRQIITGDIPSVTPEVVMSYKQLLEIQQLRNDAVTKAWQARVEEALDLARLEKLALKAI